MKQTFFGFALVVTISVFVCSDAAAICNVVYPSEARAKLFLSSYIMRTNEGLSYTYSLRSDPTSERATHSFSIKGFSGTEIKSISTAVGWFLLEGVKNRKITWIVREKGNLGILPGNELTGFRIVSRNPPEIKKSFAWTVVTWEEELKEGAIPEDCETNDTFLKSQDPEFNSVHMTAIGPKAFFPKDSHYLCDTFILELIGQVREAVAAGWIKHDLRKYREDNDGHGERKDAGKGKGNGHVKEDDESDGDRDDSDLSDTDKNLPGVAKSIIKKLTKVRRECLRGRFGSGREELRALIKQVNAQRGKHLTEEAYALIKFNAEFLLEKI